ncbi:MAG TPA: UDP-N-acetylglucosamine 2-epimerase (non-hydrolyzing) [Actinomycetota bacterium]|nr:UDP-N-acetylglucosamine 2-epimerase (non-hydrolyzing) [Actinomycetota bacterium]
MAVGTRPEAIKLAPVISALRTVPAFNVRVMATGQHREMLSSMLETFAIHPDVELGASDAEPNMNRLVARIVGRFDEVIDAEQPDLVVVQGDTTSAFAAALAAFHGGIPVVHVEAGIRSGDLLAPYPEESNRRMIRQMATLHLAPTAVNCDNLRAEGVERSHIVITGNPVIDALTSVVESREYKMRGPVALPRGGQQLVLVTAHRRESWGIGLAAIAQAVVDVAHARPDVQFVTPVHPNPRVREPLQLALADAPNIALTGPLSYPVFVRLMQVAYMILTDSGGVQEEAPSIGIPVLVMRDTTDRPEAIDAGAARLVGTERYGIAMTALRLLDDASEHAKMSLVRNIYGDGRAASRTVAAIQHYLGLGPRPAEFEPYHAETSPSASLRRREAAFGEGLEADWDEATTGCCVTNQQTGYRSWEDLSEASGSIAWSRDGGLGYRKQ